MSHKKTLTLAIRGLILGMGVLCVSTTFSAIQDVNDVPSNKAAGDRFFFSEFNKIVETLQNFWHDDSSDDVGMGEVTNPSEGICTTGYTHVDLDNDATIDNGECWRGLTVKDGDTGLGTIAPSSFLDIEKAGTAKANLDIVELTNPVNAADMDGTETSVLFNQFYYDGATPAVVDSARISVGTEQDWTSTSSTQDSYLAFETALDGTVTEYMRIISSGNVGIGTTSPDRLFHTEVSDSATNTVSFGQKISHITSDTPVASIGVGIEFEQETSADNNEVIATIEAVTTDVTSTTEDADIVFKTMTGGATATEKARIDSTGTVTATAFSGDGSALTNLGTASIVADTLDWDKFSDSMTLDASTTTTQGANTMIFNLSGTGDFDIQDNGSSAFFVSDAGYVGIGTTSPSSPLTIANDSWISAINNAGTGIVNLFKLSTSDFIEVGGPLYFPGGLGFPEDSGVVTAMDMSISSSASDNTVESYAFKIDGTNILKVSAQADGSGGIDTQTVTVTGDLTVSGTTTLGGNIIIDATDINVDTISEQTSTNGVVIDELTIKDGGIAESLTLNAADPALILDGSTASDTDFWLGVTADEGGDDNDYFQIGDGTTAGTNPFLTINTTGDVGIGLTPVSGAQLTLPQENDAATPTLAFGDGDTGLFESADDALNISIAGNSGVVLQVSGNHSISSTLDEAIGNEIALSLNYTVNKATSGNDTGLYVNQTDTASPDTSYLANFASGGNTKFNILNDGTTSIINDTWVRAIDNAGTGNVNMFKVGTTDEIYVGGALNVGTIEATEDSGAITLVNMPVSATPTDGDEMSYSFMIDADNIFKVKASADSNGGVDETQVVISPGSVGNLATLPSLSFGDGDTGFYESVDDTLQVSISGTNDFSFSTNSFASIATAPTAEILAVQATATTPTYSFTSDSDTGIGSNAADQVSIIAGGIEGVRINTIGTGVNYLDVTPAATGGNVIIATAGTDTDVDLQLTPKGTGQVFVPDGTVETPGLAFAGNTDMGIFEFGASEMGLVPSGDNPNQTIVGDAYLRGWNTNNARIYWGSGTLTNAVFVPNKVYANTGINGYMGAVENVTVQVDGVQLTKWQGTQTIIEGAGTAGAPSLAFGDGDTGFYESADDVLGFSMGGTEKITISGEGNLGFAIETGGTTTGAITIDLDGGAVQTIGLTGAVDSMATSNRSATISKSVLIVFDANGGDRTFTSFNASWKWIGTTPASLLTGKKGVLTLISTDADETGIIASYEQVD